MSGVNRRAVTCWLVRLNLRSFIVKNSEHGMVICGTTFLPGVKIYMTIFSSVMVHFYAFGVCINCFAVSLNKFIWLEVNYYLNYSKHNQNYYLKT